MTSAKTIGRRLFARATLGVPTALTFGAGSALPTSSLPYPPTMGMAATGGMSAAQVAKQTAVDKAWRAIRVEHKAEREHEDLRHQRRHMMGGLDPDLAVLNSMSLAHRVQIQIAREKAVRDRGNTLSARIMRRFGLDPEEFQ